jgi:hypothetical protein
MNMKLTHLKMTSSVKKIMVAIMICLPVWAYGQDENDLVNFLGAGKEDAAILMTAYLNPVIEGVSYGFNGGWFHTAKAHKSLGFDLGVSVNAVFIPSSKNFFDPASLGLQTVADFSSTAANGLAPTIAGPAEESTYGVDANNDGQTDFNFDGPEGLDFKDVFKVSGVLSPTIQLGVGVYKNTDLKIRWMPEVSSSSSKVKYFGVGVMHDIKQHIPGIKLLPFDLSILIGYTNIKGETSMANTFDPGNDPRPQMMDYNMDAWLFQALISKKIAVVTFYGGIGYNTIQTDSDVTGTYADPLPAPLVDPVSLSFKNSSMRVTAGIRLNLGPVYLNGDYTLQEYSTVGVGLGVTIR